MSTTASSYSRRHQPTMELTPDPFAAGLPTLAGPRVELRGLGPADEPGLLRVFGDAETMRWWSHGPLADLAAAAGYRRLIDEGLRSRTLFQWGVFARDGGALMGTCTLSDWRPAHRRAELGYILHRDHWGRGLASEAVRTALGFAFGPMGVHRVEADIDPDNAASIALVERLGFVREGRLRERWWPYGEAQDSLIYGLLATEWDGTRG
jgi:RimJ/RimL family protein N-acetyltransferase